jgi:heme exporter protein A
MPEARPAGQALLTFETVACARGGRMLWRGLSLTLDAGALIHVTGANGCGKSSLLRLAAGLLPPLSGTVMRPAEAGLIDEKPALDNDLSLIRALAFWQSLGSAMAPADALGATGIDHLADVPVRILSTGQRKRAALARLLIEGRPLWLLDEPANGLDDAGIAMLCHLIAAHQAGGGSVLLASHQPLPIADAAPLALADFAA